MTGDDRMVLTIDGQPCAARRGQSVAALLLQQGMPARTSRSGQPRTPWCGMGVCGECRVRVAGREGVLACLLPCAPGLVIVTGGLA